MTLMLRQEMLLTFLSAVTGHGRNMVSPCMAIAHETGKIVDNAVMSKYCVGCRQWEKWDKTSSQYMEWKASHVCGANYEGSLGEM